MNDKVALFTIRAVAVTLVGLASVQAADSPQPHAEAVAADNPAVYWRFPAAPGKAVVPDIVQGDTSLLGTLVGSSAIADATLTNKQYPTFSADNRSLTVGGAKSYLRVRDPGDSSLLDFHNGDAITIEAWVNPESVADGQQIYIVSKGRTQNADYKAENHNYGLRLRGAGGTARVSFLFRNENNRSKTTDDYHRWTSSDGFVVDGRWHHVAVVYEFGTPDSIRAYVDGRETSGDWDLGGKTTLPPVVDNDELWIGSALGGNRHSTFQGAIDEVAIYRAAVPAERLKTRYHAIEPDWKAEEFAAAAELPDDRVTVEVHERIPPTGTWRFGLADPSLRYSQTSLAFVGLPKKYDAQGVIADYSNPVLLRARTKWDVSEEEAGEYQILLRSRGGARFFIDGMLATQTAFQSRNSSGHEAVPELAAAEHENLRALPPAFQEELVTVELEPGPHVLRLDAIIGGKGLRLELHELWVAIARPGEPFHVVVAEGTDPIAMTDASWERHAAELRADLARIDRASRESASTAWRERWDKRHDAARAKLAERQPLRVPASPDGYQANNAIDQFINRRLAVEEVQPVELTGDYAFVRRLALDTVGVVPSRAEIARFLTDDAGQRRELLIDRYLDDPRWADHWVGYWQDVLAENPGILKPKLNNTGPFRWWIYDSFLDNKPIDRFVAELVTMGGSKYYGGPAGFAMATENDAPMAAKAHVLAKAFLGMDLTCARCHDAPYHPFKQEQLFSLAAMLRREPIKLPKTSTVPLAEGARQPLVEISLKPGDRIDPTWPFAHVVAVTTPADAGAVDSREQLAELLTSVDNARFAKVIVNRLWRRYLGRGLIEPVDDWETVEGAATHPELLEFLARELINSGYDLKHVARLILNSRTYQRRIDHRFAEKAELFASPRPRRLTAEQVVDSLVTVSGKPLDTEQLTLDPDGRRSVETFLNLGRPSRAWQFTSLSNERDRPALALPAAQSVIDLLLAYGWRDSRPHPTTIRDETPTVLQPLTLANGIAGARAVRLSDDSAITQLCLEEIDVYELVRRTTLQILSRPPTDDEQRLFVEQLRDGFEDRVVANPPPVRRNRRRPTAVSWSNHLNAEATKIKQELERAVLAGDPPTNLLQQGWRERMEDVVWALTNSPEFVFVP